MLFARKVVLIMKADKRQFYPNVRSRLPPQIPMKLSRCEKKRRYMIAASRRDRTLRPDFHGEYETEREGGLFRLICRSGWSLSTLGRYQRRNASGSAGAQDKCRSPAARWLPQKVQAKAFFEPAAKELGISVLQDSHGGYAKIKAQVMSGSPGYDLVALGCAEAARAAKEGLLEPLDYSLIPNANEVDARLRAPITWASGHSRRCWPGTRRR